MLLDLTVIIIIGSAAALPLEEESIALWNGIVPILVMSFLQYVLSVINLHWRGAEKVTCGYVYSPCNEWADSPRQPQAGKGFLSDLHIVLRQSKRRSDRIEDVALAVLELTGEVSVILKKEAQPVSVKDMGMSNLSRIDDMMSISLNAAQEAKFEIRMPIKNRASSRRTPK